MGESAGTRKAEADTVRAAIDAGLTLIDTAEMYGEGGAEEVVGDALAGRAGGVFVVSKVYPHNAGRKEAVAACERSLKRLRRDSIDLYLLHWRGSVPLAETVEAFDHLKRQGKIRHWGVSNFDVTDLEELWTLSGGKGCAANQVLYHLGSRGIEYDLLPRSQQEGLATMAYSPLGVGSILADPAVVAIARRHGVPGGGGFAPPTGFSPAAVAVAWTIRDGSVISIPKTARRDRLAALAAAGSLELSSDDLAQLDKAFPPPRKKQPLATS
jgi:diketogulonate reductase-like aldo/keto reductase